MGRSIDRFETAHGVCTIVALEDHEVEEAYASLPAAERAYADSLGPVRRREVICGRTALHDALASLEPNLATSPILADDRGAPVLPAGWVGSVSHKGERGAALVAPVSEARVGVDLELAQPSRQDIARFILTRREQDALADRGKGATLRFSGVPAPTHVLEATSGDTVWTLDGGDLSLGALHAGETRTEVLRITVPPWALPPKFS